MNQPSEESPLFNDRACMLVGRYFFYFATLERTLHSAIKYLFDLKAVQTEMMLANITVRDKVNIVKTAVAFYSIVHFSEEWRNRALKTLEQIITETNQRNFLAHTQFYAVKDGVEFFKVKAKGKLEIPDIVWGDRDFDARYDNVMDLSKAVRSIIDEMKEKKLAVKMAEELAKPTEGSNALGFLFGLGLQGPEHLGSGPQESTGEKELQTNPNPLPKGEEGK